MRWRDEGPDEREAGDERTGYGHWSDDAPTRGAPAPGAEGASGAEHVCDRCGSAMIERHCKIVCLRCGYQRDCTDP